MGRDAFENALVRNFTLWHKQTYNSNLCYVNVRLYTAKGVEKSNRSSHVDEDRINLVHRLFFERFMCCGWSIHLNKGAAEQLEDCLELNPSVIHPRFD